MARPILVNSSTTNATDWPTTAMPIIACAPNNAPTRIEATKERSMSPRSAWPSSKASQSATPRPSSTRSKPVDAKASQLGTIPSGMIS
ncbi:Uncharacterised protein [Mycobacteroides abscessus subsp. abscessus]|nr:Uncharacterised protein [Mycobacteroides abscessus subsp. abscessus]SKV77057.1 Uncharacterised protein [Mycobacteroides abscessus subsp. abscessus]